MTTAIPAPLTAFRTSRDTFLGTVMSGVSGLEEAVLAFEHEHQRRTAAAEAEAAAMARKVNDLNFQLGEAAEALDAARTGQPAVPVDETELVEARETIRLLREELDLRRQEDLDKAQAAEEDAGEAVDVEGLRRDLDAALATIEEQNREAEEAQRESADELAAAKASWQADRASISDSNARLSEEILALRQGIDGQLAAGRTAATAEAVRVLAAVAADSPDVPLSEAMDLVVIAMDLPEDFAVSEAEAPAPQEETAQVEDVQEAAVPEEAPEPEPAADDVPEADPMLDERFFDGLQAPEVQGAGSDEPLFAPVADSFEPDHEGGTPIFDLDAAQEELLHEEPAAAKEIPKPGFSLFGRNNAA